MSQLLASQSKIKRNKVELRIEQKLGAELVKKLLLTVGSMLVSN